MSLETEINKDLNQNLNGSNNSNRNTIFTYFKKNIRQYTMIIALVVIWCIFTITTNGNFISSVNLTNLFMQTCITAILAVGMVLVMVGGHIDLSVGRLLGFTGAISAILQVNYKMGTIPAIIITLAVGILVGLWHGYWIAFRQVPAFIVTLASMLMFQGFSLFVTQGQTLAPLNDSHKAIGQGYLPNFIPDLQINLFGNITPFNDSTVLVGLLCIIGFCIFDLRKRKARIKYGFNVLSMPLQIAKLVGLSLVIAAVFSILVTYKGIPFAILLLLALVLLYSFISQNTTFGRHIYAIGGNKEAAKYSGINIKKINMLIFVNMGLITAIASLVFTARINSATAQAGVNLELEAIAAAVIGGTSTMGGEGSIIGAVIGALVMGSLDNGMSNMGLSDTYQFVIKGLILLLAVAVDIMTKKKS